jgi:hypothetical protein
VVVAEAFASADDTRALLRTPAGSMEIELRTGHRARCAAQAVAAGA